MKFPSFSRKKASELQSRPDDKVLAEARELAANRLAQYIADRQVTPADALGSIKKSDSASTRLRWWW